MNFKFGVVYAKPGQIMDDELFSNETDSEKFTNFERLAKVPWWVGYSREHDWSRKCVHAA